MRLISQHLLRAVTGPFCFGLFVITFLMIIDVLFRYVDLFVSKGVPFLVATKVLVLSLGFTLALSVPMAVLIGILMGVGQLAADNEITALKASGVSLYSVLRPLLLWSGLIMLALTAFNHWVYPESNHTLANLLYDIKRSRPMLDVREQMFTDLNEQLTIFVKSKDDVTGKVTDVTLIEKEQPGQLSPRITTARWGRILPDSDTDAMTIELYDGEIHELPDPQRPDKYQVIRFKRHDIVLTDMERDLEDSQRKSRGDREMNLTDLLAAAREQAAQESSMASQLTSLRDGLVEYQWGLLDPERRAALATAPPLNPAERRARHVATRGKVEHAASQASAQAKVRRNYVRRQNKYLVEFHKKLAIPAACLVFALLGVPMAVTTSRSGKGVSVSLALAVYLIYYLCIAGGEKLADRGMLDPAVGMWAGNVVLLAIGIPIFVRTVRETTIIEPRWPWRRGRRAAAGGGTAA